MNNRLLPPNATLDQRVEFALADAEQYANTGFEKLLVQLVKDQKVEVERLHRAFRHYGHHDGDCEHCKGVTTDCTCGYSDILRGLGE